MRDSLRGTPLDCGSFSGTRLDEQVLDHSTISRTRWLIDVETHQQVFLWILEGSRDHGLLKGKTVRIDGATLASVVHANRRRVHGAYGQHLLGKRGERIDGALRTTTTPGHETNTSARA